MNPNETHKYIFRMLTSMDPGSVGSVRCAVNRARIHGKEARFLGQIEHFQEHASALETLADEHLSLGKLITLANCNKKDPDQIREQIEEAKSYSIDYSATMQGIASPYLDRYRKAAEISKQRLAKTNNLGTVILEMSYLLAFESELITKATRIRSNRYKPDDKKLVINPKSDTENPLEICKRFYEDIEGKPFEGDIQYLSHESINNHQTWLQEYKTRLEKAREEKE